MSTAQPPIPKPPVQHRPTRPTPVEIAGLRIPVWDLINLIVTFWVATFALTVAVSAFCGIVFVAVMFVFRAVMA